MGGGERDKERSGCHHTSSCMYFLFSSGVAVVNDVVGATGGAVFPGPAASERWLLSTQVQIALCGRVSVTGPRQTALSSQARSPQLVPIGWVP